MKILIDSILLKNLKADEIDKIKAQIYQIINDNYEDYFVKTLVQEISGTIVEFQFDYDSDEVYVRDC